MTAAASCVPGSSTWPDAVLGAVVVVGFCFVLWLVLR